MVVHRTGDCLILNLYRKLSGLSLIDHQTCNPRAWILLPPKFWSVVKFLANLLNLLSRNLGKLHCAFNAEHCKRWLNLIFYHPQGRGGGGGAFPGQRPAGQRGQKSPDRDSPDRSLHPVSVAGGIHHTGMHSCYL